MEIELSHCLGEGKEKKCGVAHVVSLLFWREDGRPARGKKCFVFFLFLSCFVLCVCGINLSISAENNKEIIYYFFVLESLYYKLEISNLVTLLTYSTPVSLNRKQTDKSNLLII